MKNKLSRLAAALAVGLAPILSVAFPGIAHAATKTWTGGGVDGNWSTTGNWSGGSVPANGDVVVIDNSASFANGSKDDIANLNLAGITFTNNASSGDVTVNLGANLTLSGPVTQDTTVTTSTDSIMGVTSARTITLGADVTFMTTTGMSIGDETNSDILALNGHTATFADNNASGAIVAIGAIISGAGSVVYNSLGTEYQLWADNTYSGTTHVVSTDANGVYKSSSTNGDPFGTSAVTVETAGNIGLSNYGASTTLSNQFIITGTTSGSAVTSMTFDDDGTAGITLTVPNITLNGDTRFGNSSAASPKMVVNLAGITANGHCIEYLGGAATGVIDGPSNGFTNGPAGCVVDASIGGSSSAPKTPNTGFALVKANPLLSATVATVAAVTIAGVALKLRTSPARR